ncbi:MAG: L-histidine N(alpha)-methyltransferase [Rhodospirillales bacterium]|nr:L-histidine N(alpha)-methyltransferase [Rhodospirillales bacterium]
MNVNPARMTAFHDLEPELEDFETAVMTGLSHTPKTLPCKFFYDQEGSRLFDLICELPEYYPTRTEIALLEMRAGEMATLMGPRCHVIEFGSGSSIKIRTLLNAMEDPAACTAVDISRDHLIASAEDLAGEFPDVEITAICADYTQPFDVIPPKFHPDARRVGFFPGSTIGNFTPDEAVEFLSKAAKLLSGGDFLVGIDLKKDKARLEAAYDDAQGVTAAFNLNLLTRINRELDGNFQLDGFAHQALYNETLGRVEMHLRSLRAQSVMIGGRSFDFAADETIHTENSHKYSIEGFQALAARAGFSALHSWTDPDDLFSVHYLRATV